MKPADQRSERPTNIVWHEGEVIRADRAAVLGHKGCTLWLTGLSGSGKSTIGVALEKALIARAVLAYRLDGDNVRHGLCANLGFSAADREENIRRVGEVARLMADAGLVVISSFISPYQRDRDRVRALHEQSGLAFLEVFIDTPLEVCESRDPKGLYKKARAGEIKDFTGIDDPYEATKNPEVHLRTAETTIGESVEILISALQSSGVMSR